MEYLGPIPPPVIAGAPSRLIPSGSAAYDRRFGGLELGHLVVVTAQREDLAAEICGGAVAHALELRYNVALADFEGAILRELGRRRAVLPDASVHRHAQADVPVREIVARTESWKLYDAALQVLVVADLARVRSPLGHAVQQLKLLARRCEILVVVGARGPRPGTDGSLLGHFWELPEPADAVLQLDEQRPGAMFPPTHRLHIRKARPHAEVSMQVQRDETGGWAELSVSA